MGFTSRINSTSPIASWFRKLVKMMKKGTKNKYFMTGVYNINI
jgi:hypothetical protein